MERINWKGHLTASQQKIADEHLLAWDQRRHHLTYAVTGAGKTEMLYPLINRALGLQKRIALVAPRIDVVLELARRIEKNFSGEFLILHGNQHHIKYNQLVICTIQQLMKFHQTFDLIIVDEVDAFPLIDNSALKRVIEMAREKDGVIHYLSATPTNKLLKEVGHAQGKVSFLAKRYHGHPLPKIKIKFTRNWRKKLPRTLNRELLKYQKNKRYFLIFVPQITDLSLVSAMLPKSLHVKTVYANDQQRSDTIEMFRRGELHGLIATTILERGVTFSPLDVYILGGEERIFTYETILQMAGRCGRSADFPTGNVWIFAKDFSFKMYRAQQEIIFLNRIGVQNEM
ncbi:DEAD/DEAH box helicase family protein [Weissella coleopterorum]|nr:DEAD/DEAH box helicase family protein [Weissella coleopterorum]